MTKFWQSKLFSFNILMVMKTKSIICALAAMLVALGCNKTQDPAYEGTNYIYLSLSSDSMSEKQSNPLVVNVTLTTALMSDIVLDFEIEGPDGVLELDGVPLTIKAGEKSAQFSIISKQAGLLKEAATFKLKLAAGSVLPDGIELKEPLSFIVTINEESPLTEAEQKAIIEAYKKATDVDLSKYLGLVPVSVNVVSIDPETEKPVEKVIEGSTNIILSKDSNTEYPVLKMTSNAMGLRDLMYNALRASTVADEEYWTNAEYYPINALLMEKIKWDANSDEMFEMSLDNIVLKGTELSYIAEVTDPRDINTENDPDYEFAKITIVPFDFDFSAYERELQAIEAGSFERGEYDSDATANPYYWLNCYDIISNDEFESDLWVEPSAVISNEKLEFSFCFSNYIDSDFNRATVTYFPIK